MLYLTNCELKGGYPVPAEQWLEMVIKGMEDLVTYRNEGKVVLHVGHAGKQAGTIIWDVASHEELMDILSQLPYWPFMEWKIIPLISTEKTLDSLKKSLEAAKAA